MILVRHNDKPWISSELKKEIRKTDRLRPKFLRLKTLSTEQKYNWTDIFQTWGKLRERSSESDDIPTNILTQSIWFNKKLKSDNTLVFCIINGVMQEYFL
jgi:hypothetical protein